jgi:hypothetical protein
MPSALAIARTANKTNAYVSIQFFVFIEAFKVAIFKNGFKQIVEILILVKCDHSNDANRPAIKSKIVEFFAFQQFNKVRECKIPRKK